MKIKIASIFIGIIIGTIITGYALAQGGFWVPDANDDLEPLDNSWGIRLGGTSTPDLRFYEAANYIGFTAPALTGNQIWTLPNADGNANEFLQTDGSGNLDWVSVAGGHDAVTLAGTPDYITISGQVITRTKLDINDDTNATGGVGIDITTNDFTFDATELDALTWSDGSNASNQWTFDVSGTDHTMTFGNGAVGFSNNVGIGDTTPDAVLEVTTNGLASAHFMVSSTASGDGDYLLVDSSGDTTVGNNLILGDNQQIWLDTSKTLGIGYNTDVGDMTWKGDALAFEGSAQWFAHTNSDGSGTYEPSFSLDSPVVFKNLTEGSVNDRYFEINMNSGARITQGNFFVSTGDVGIGDTTPDAVLEIVSQSGSASFMISNVAAGDGDFFIVDSSGNIGINDTTPDFLLDVEGTMGVTTLTINNAITLPTFDGTSDQVMTTDGSGNLSWSAAGSGDVTDVYNCSSGDCNQLTMGATEFLDATSGMITLPVDGTIDTQGDIGWDTTTGQLQIFDGSVVQAIDPDRYPAIAVQSPSDGSVIIIGKMPNDITITDIHCIIDPDRSSETAVVDVQECDSTGDNCVTVDATITCDNDGAEDDGSFSNGSIDSGDWVVLDIGAVSDPVTWLNVHIYYSIDPK